MSSSWSRRRQRGPAWIVLKTFEIAAARTSGLFNTVFSHHTGFSSASIYFFVKPLVIPEPSIPSVQLLGLSSKLYLGKMQRMFNKDLTRFMQSFQVLQIRGSEKQTCPQKKGGVYVVGFITTLYWRVNPKDEKLDLLHFWPASKVNSNNYITSLLNPMPLIKMKSNT